MSLALSRMCLNLATMQTARSIADCLVYVLSLTCSAAKSTSAAPSAAGPHAHKYSSSSSLVVVEEALQRCSAFWETYTCREKKNIHPIHPTTLVDIKEIAVKDRKKESPKSVYIAPEALQRCKRSQPTAAKHFKVQRRSAARKEKSAASA